MDDTGYCLCECSSDVGVEALLDDEEVSAVCRQVLLAEGIVRPCMVSVSFVSTQQIAVLNRDYRGCPEPTDVLSIECEAPDDPDLSAEEPCELGDIVLASAYIARQAKKFCTTAKDECRLLLIHGMLHLLGYDHLDELSAENMETRTLAILATITSDHTVDRLTLTRHREDTSA